jgi:CBS domain-containing protein
MSVKQLMSTQVVTIGDAASCREAVALMCRHKVRHLPVVGRQGLLCGIVTDRDLRHHLFRPDVFGAIGNVPVEQLLAAVPVSEIMSAPVLSVAPEASLQEAAGIMRDGKLGSLPVVKDGHIMGILTETDLLRRIVGTDTGAYDVAEIVVSYP